MADENKRTVFESLIGKAKEQDEDVEKNAKRNRKRFVELLQKTREVTARTTFEDAAKLLSVSPAWDAVDENTRRQCFDIFVDQLKIQSQAAGGDDDAEEEDKRKAEKKVKSKRKKDEPPEEPEPPPKKASKRAKEPEPPPKEADEGKKRKK